MIKELIIRNFEKKVEKKKRKRKRKLRRKRKKKEKRTNRLYVIKLGINLNNIEHPYNVVYQIV